MRIESWSYQAALYCDDCKPDGSCKDSEGCDDSDCCPQPNFSSESDSPDHCSACGVFLKNALTGDGMDYVREMLCGAVDDSGAHGDVAATKAEWRDFYELDKPRNWPVRSVRMEDLAEALAERYRGIYGLYSGSTRYALDVGSPDSELGKIRSVFVASDSAAGMHAARDTDHEFTADALACFLSWMLDGAHAGMITAGIAALGITDHRQGFTSAPEIAREILLEDFRIAVIDPHATCAEQSAEVCVSADRCAE